MLLKGQTQTQGLFTFTHRAFAGSFKCRNHYISKCQKRCHQHSSFQFHSCFRSKMLLPLSSTLLCAHTFISYLAYHHIISILLCRSLSSITVRYHSPFMSLLCTLIFAVGREGKERAIEVQQDKIYVIAYI